MVDQQYERVKKLLLEHQEGCSSAFSLPKSTQEKLKALTGRHSSWVSHSLQRRGLDAKETLAYNELVEVLGERPYAIKPLGSIDFKMF